MRLDTTPGTPRRLELLKALMVECLSEEPARRPKLPMLLDRAELLRAEELEEEEELLAAAAGASTSDSDYMIRQLPPAVTSTGTLSTSSASTSLGSVPTSSTSGASSLQAPRVSASSGPSFDTVALEEAMQGLKIPTGVWEAACEAVADTHGDCVHASQLVEVLVAAGVPSRDVLSTYMHLVKVRHCCMCQHREGEGGVRCSHSLLYLCTYLNIVRSLWTAAGVCRGCVPTPGPSDRHDRTGHATRRGDCSGHQAAGTSPPVHWAGIGCGILRVAQQRPAWWSCGHLRGE